MWRVKPYEEFSDLSLMINADTMEWIEFNFNPESESDVNYYETKFFNGFKSITKKEYDSRTVIFNRVCV